MGNIAGRLVIDSIVVVLILVVILAFFFLLFLTFLHHIQKFFLVVVVRNGSLSSYALKGEQFPAHLEAEASLEGIGQNIFLDQDQGTKFTFVIFE